MLCGPCSWSGLVRVFLISLGDHLENFEVEECFQRECLGETLSGKEAKGVFIFLTKSVRSQQSVRSWWGFLDRRFNRGDYEATSRLVHNSNPYWTWHVCPIEQFSTQSYTSSLRPLLHMLAFGILGSENLVALCNKLEMDGRRTSKSNNKYHCSVTIHFKFITKCDSLFYFKMRWSFITKYDSFFITKCYKCYNYKVRQIY